MAISVNWATKVITVPKADTLLIQASPEIRQLDINTFRLDLKNLEDDSDGMPFSDTHNHNPPVTVGGVTLARVVEIINGYTVTFEDGQYAVNLAGANSNIGDVVNVNQVSVRSANSAGLTYSKEIEDQSFVDARIFIDVNGGTAGASYPRGTATDPTNNFTDALAINSNRNLPGRYLLKGNVATGGVSIVGTDWEGTHLPLDTISLDSSDATRCAFRNILLSGSATGVYTCFNCVLSGVSGFEGFLFGGAIGGTLTLAGEAHLVNTHAAATGADSITIDLDGNACDVFIPGWEGNMVITNCSNAASKIAIDSRGGAITLDASCTAGIISVRGNADLTDNSSGSTVYTEALINPKIDKTLSLEEGDPDIIPASDLGNGRHIVRDKDTAQVIIDKTIVKTGNQYTWSDT